MAVLSFWLGASTSARAAEVVALGDTWSSGAAAALQASLGTASLNYTVADWGSPLGTAEYYATTGTATITAALAANPDAQWVWLSVGFDDLVNRYPAESATQIAIATEANLNAVLTTIFAAAPNVRVVMFGYDYPNYVQTPACQTQLATDFGPTATQLDVNTLLVTTVAASMQAVASNFPAVHYIPLYGTLQVAGGGAADGTQPSPASLMADCTHPSAAGYAALTDALVAAYWQAPVPFAAGSANPSTICSGDVVTFTSLSTQNEGQLWRMQGVLTSIQTTWMAAISGTTTASVTLEAYNFAWTDTATITVTINNCADAGVIDTGVIDSGLVDSGLVDAGFPDAAPDAAVDAGFPDAAPDAAIDAGFPDAAPDAAIDAGFPDAAPDAAIDAGFPDAAPDAEVDAGFPDAEVDAGFPDAEVDAGFPDAEVDAGFPDAEVDAGFPDAEVDAGFPDAEVDAGFPDAEVDAGFPDAEVDAGFPDAAPDAAVVDTGVAPADAGTGLADAGANVFDDIGITGSGCSCEAERAPSSGAPSAWLAASLFLLFGLRRRRR